MYTVHIVYICSYTYDYICVCQSSFSSQICLKGSQDRRPHGFYDGPLRTFGWTLPRWVLIPSLTWDLFCSSERPNWRTWTIVDGLHVENDWETLAGSFLGNRFCDHWRTLKTHDSNRPGLAKRNESPQQAWLDKMPAGKRLLQSESSGTGTKIS